MPITFGCELEFQQNVPELVQWLHENHPDLMLYPEMHRYHCDCDDCEEGLLKAQTDSSCSGEIITGVFNEIDEAREIFEIIEKGAVEVDAEPGWDAGLHVHVMPPPAHGFRMEAFLQWLRWEQVLMCLAAGRFPEMRGNNRSLQEDLTYMVRNDLQVMSGRTPPWIGTVRYRYSEAIHWIAYSEDITPEDRTNLIAQIFSFHQMQDRHSLLNLRTRYDTWEWRLFNSTRSAWRMEMYAQIARAWLDREFISTLQSHDAAVLSGDDLDLRILQTALATYDERAGALLARQINYMQTVDAYELPPFTVA